MVYLAYAMLALATLIAVGNVGGLVAAAKSKRGYSTVPLLSLVICTAAFYIARDAIGAWAFLPALVDPGNWVLVLLPGYLIYRLMMDRRDSRR